MFHKKAGPPMVTWSGAGPYWADLRDL